MSDRPIPETHAPRAVVLAGVVATLLAVAGAVVVGVAVVAGPLPGDWVLFAVPAVGLLGFAGLGTVLTAFIDR
ncbi:hypothetical protein [Halomarina litorea]|uniref:hypothetical protein n=1 Tax=Halomarina litorea TaxID=2961595 RepID=UPI0020C514D0|nr:hypothetical protein [Halomarina sp. BCD28]